MEYKINQKIKEVFQESFQLNPFHAILNARGIEDVQAYLNADESNLHPFNLLDNIYDGANAIIDAATTEKNIFVQVDSDNDGVTSAAELVNYLKAVFPNVKIKYRMHTGKQHGVVVDTVPDDTDLVIIPDAGSNQYDEHLELHNRGMKVVVIDHHICEKYSDHAIVINNQLSEDYPNKSLSGAGVVFKVCQCMDELMGISMANSFLDLAAVGIIGDMMELIDLETRYIVNYGLSHINNAGLRAIINKLEYSIGDINTITPTTVSYYITPLLNALIRVGSADDKELLFFAFIDGQKAVPSSKRGCKPGDMEIAGDKIARIGSNAKAKQKKMIDKGMDILEIKIHNLDLNENKIILLALNEEESDLIDPNLTGLIAMKILHKYRKPTFVLREGSDGVFKGSCRGDSNGAISQLKDFVSDSNLVTFAEGHQMAFGLGIKKHNLDKFVEYANNALKDVDTSRNCYEVDFVFTSNDSEDLKTLAFALDGYKTLWGRGVEEPVVICKDIYIDKHTVKFMGAGKNSIGINFGGVSLVKIKDSQLADELMNLDYGTITIVGSVSMNEYAGRKTPQVIIRGYEINTGLAGF